MRHGKKKKIGKGTDHRRKLLRSLASSVILYERIETTLQNARAARSYVERAVTQAKDSSLHSRRLLLSRLTPMAAKKALEVLGPRFKDRKGGYTRLTKLAGSESGRSRVVLEFVA